MRECTEEVVPHNSAVVKDFLEPNCGFGAFMRGKIGFASQASRVETFIGRRRKWPPQKRAAISIQRCADA